MSSEILEKLLKNYNDGRKNYYCLAVNLLTIEDLNEIMKKIENEIAILNVEEKQKISHIISLFVCLHGIYQRFT